MRRPVLSAHLSLVIQLTTACRHSVLLFPIPWFRWQTLPLPTVWKFSSRQCQDVVSCARNAEKETWCTLGCVKRTLNLRYSVRSGYVTLLTLVVCRGLHCTMQLVLAVTWCVDHQCSLSSGFRSWTLNGWVMMGFCIWWGTVAYVACAQVCGYFYTVRGCFYTGRAFQALNKVTQATEIFRTWLLHRRFELPTVCRQ